MGIKFELFLGHTDHVLLTSSNNKKVVPAFSSVTNLLGQNFSPEVYSFVWFGFSPSQCRIIPYFLISMVEHIMAWKGEKSTMVSVSPKRILSILETVFCISINLYELGIGKSFLYLCAQFNADWASHAGGWCSCLRFCFLWVKRYD